MCRRGDMKNKRVVPTDEQISVLNSLVKNFEQEETKARSLALLNSRSGFEKWYRRQYGFPFDPNLFVAKKPRRHGGHFLIRDAARAAGIGDQSVLVCSLGGISETVLEEAISSGCPPILVMSSPLLLSGFVLFWDEYDEFQISSNLWKRLGLSEDQWIAS